MNCEDVAMQMFISGLTRSPPVAVNVQTPIIDYGAEDDGLITREDHQRDKAICLKQLHEKCFNNKTGVLMYNTELVNKFSNIQNVKKNNN